MPALLDPRESHYRIPGSQPGLSLFLRHLPPPEGTPARGIVLYVHGATFPSALSIAHRFDGRSWRDELCEAGFHVWGFDFHGYGHSDPYPAMAEPPDGCEPLCTVEDAWRQLELAVRFICQHHATERISLIAHSWGTIVAGRFADRLSEARRASGAVRRHRAARRRRRAAALPAVAIGFAAGPMAAFHRRSAGRRTARAVAPAFRPMERTLSGQRPGEPHTNTTERPDAERAVVRHRPRLDRRSGL